MSPSQSFQRYNKSPRAQYNVIAIDVQTLLLQSSVVNVIVVCVTLALSTSIRWGPSAFIRFHA